MSLESQPKKESREKLAESGYKEALRRLLTLPSGEHKELRGELDSYEGILSREVTKRIMLEVTKELDEIRKLAK